MGKGKHTLPDYTKGEEILNMVSHIVGGAFGIVALVLCIVKAAIGGNTAGVVGSAIYGAAMILVYTTSSIYHGLHRNGGIKHRIAQRSIKIRIANQRNILVLKLCRERIEHTLREINARHTRRRIQRKIIFSEK